jgi:GAF domain-containing protein/HAMP domain-containing protein
MRKSPRMRAIPKNVFLQRVARALRGLRTKIIGWSFAPTALVSIAVVALTFYAYQRVTEDLVFERNRELAELMAGQLTAELVDYERRLALVAAQVGSEFWLTAGKEELQALLNAQWTPESLQVFDGGVLVIDRTGHVVAAQPEHWDVVGQDVAGRAYISQACRSGQAAYSDMVADGVGGAEALAIAVPLLGDAGSGGGPCPAIVGLFRAERGATRTSAFYGSVWKLYIGRHKAAYLVDRQGRVIFHPDTFFIGEDWSAGEAVRHVLRGESGALRTRDVEGQEIVAAYAPLPGTGWGLVVEESWATLIGASQRYGRLLLLLLGLGLLLPVLFIVLGMRQIMRPISRLTRAAERVADAEPAGLGAALRSGGRPVGEIQVDTGDELQTLAEQFTRMANRLQESYATLEQRVDDRTRELAALNAVAAVVSRSLDLHEILDDALSEILDSTGISAGAAFRLEQDGCPEPAGQTLVLMAQRGLSDEFSRHIAQLPLEASLAGVAAREGRPVACPAADYPEGALKRQMIREGLQLAVSVPLTAKGRMLGAINLATTGPRSISPQELDLLASIGQQVGLALENARLYEQAERSAAAAERNRLARELHDAVSQTLFSASLIADVLPRLWKRDPQRGEQSLAQLRQLTRGALAEMRTLLFELRPQALEAACPGSRGTFAHRGFAPDGPPARCGRRGGL